MSTSDRPALVLPALVAAQFAGTSLWFAGNAILPDIQAAWSLPAGALGWVTSSVQLGFIVGTLLSAIFTLADRVSAPRLFFAASVMGALVNLGPLVFEGLWHLLGFRFLTGVALAGIYPVGMKLAASWYHKGLGSALGWLVGALVLGTAAPHLVRALGAGSLSWQVVLAVISALAASGGLLVLLVVGEGPMATKNSAGFNPSALGALFRVPRFRAAALGYFGHMWELYAFWAFVPAILASYAAREEVALSTSWASFAIIAAGAIGCVVGGRRALRVGSARVAMIQVVASGALALTAPLWFAAAQICFVGLRGLLFHAGARLCGGRGGLGVSVWACGYVHATQLLGFLLTLAGLVPGVGGLLVLLGWLAIEARIALTLTTVARAQHGLSAGRATFAGWASFLGLGALGLVSCVLLSALVVAAFQAAGWP